jgi:hypothetical protein
MLLAISNGLMGASNVKALLGDDVGLVDADPSLSS